MTDPKDIQNLALAGIDANAAVDDLLSNEMADEARRIKQIADRLSRDYIVDLESALMTDNSGDLVRRLREQKTMSQFLRSSDLYASLTQDRVEAADRIEQLEHAAERNRAALSHAAIFAGRTRELNKAQELAHRRQAELLEAVDIEADTLAWALLGVRNLIDFTEADRHRYPDNIDEALQIAQRRVKG